MRPISKPLGLPMPDRRILRLDQLHNTAHVLYKPALTKLRQIHLGIDRTSIATVPEIGEVDRQEEAIITLDGDTEQSITQLDADMCIRQWEPPVQIHLVTVYVHRKLPWLNVDRSVQYHRLQDR